MSVAENMELGRLKRRNGAGIHWDERRSSRSSRASRSAGARPPTTSRAASSRWWRWRARSPATPRLLLLDEPFEGLAPAIVRGAVRALRQAAPGGRILIVDHHLDLALALSDRTVALERGASRTSGPRRRFRATSSCAQGTLAVTGRTTT
jgi:ABC-type sugar transport system ATPase subunit